MTVDTSNPDRKPLNFDLRWLLPIALPPALAFSTVWLFTALGVPPSEVARVLIGLLALLFGIMGGLFVAIEGKPDHWAVIDLRRVWDWFMGETE